MFQQSQKIKIIIEINDHIEEHLYIDDDYDFFTQIQNIQRIYDLQNFPLSKIIKKKIFSVQNKTSKTHSKNEVQSNILSIKNSKSLKKHSRKKSLQIELKDTQKNLKKHKKKLSFSYLNRTLTSNRKKMMVKPLEINLYKKCKKQSQTTLNKTLTKKSFNEPKQKASLKNSIYSSIKKRKKFIKPNKENTANQNIKKKSILKNKNQNLIKELQNIYNKLDSQRIGLISFKNLDLNCLSSKQLNIVQDYLLQMSYNSSKNFSLDEFLQLSSSF